MENEMMSQEIRYHKVSVILLNYNGEKLAPLWESLFNIDYDNYEIIFVDNGSIDGSLNHFRKLQAKYSHIDTKVVKIPKNVGYSKANNYGKQRATGKYIVLLSNDIEVTPDWMKNMIQAFEMHPKLAIAQSNLHYLYDRKMRDYQCNNIDVLGFCHVAPLEEEVEEVFYSEGAVMFIRRSVLNEVGGLFDKDNFMFEEDIDLCWRVRLRGYKVGVVKSSIAYHARGGTVPGVVMKTDPFYVHLTTRNKIATYFKNFGTKNLIKYLPLVISVAFAKGLWLIAKGKLDGGLATFRGVGAFLKRLRKNFSKRIFHQSLRKVPDSEALNMVFPIGYAILGGLQAMTKVRKEWVKK